MIITTAVNVYDNIVTLYIAYIRPSSIVVIVEYRRFCDRAHCTIFQSYSSSELKSWNNTYMYVIKSNFSFYSREFTKTY